MCELLILPKFLSSRVHCDANATVLGTAHQVSPDSILGGPIEALAGVEACCPQVVGKHACKQAVALLQTLQTHISTVQAKAATLFVVTELLPAGEVFRGDGPHDRPHTGAST